MTALVSGTAVTLKFDGTGTAAAGNFVGVEVRICKGGLSNIALQSAYNPTQGGNCLPPSGDPSISADTYGAVNDRDIIVTSDPTNTSATVVFHVGTGSTTFQANSVSTVTCNATNPCSLWAKEQFKTSFYAPGAGFWHFDLNYAGAPTAPAATAIAGNTTGTVNWTAPTNAGNAPITGYTVTLSPGGATQTVSGSTTTANFTGLSNFTAYTASVTATNTAADGTTNTSPAGTASFTPSPPAPTAPAAVAANQSALLTWNAPTGPAPTGYSVVIHQVTPAGADIGPIATGSTGTSYNATGLTNGTVYTFQVAAVYPGPQTGGLSATSAAFTPQGKFVTQTITVTRPQGDLVLTQICGNHTDIPADPAVGNWWPGSAAIPAVTTGTAPNLGSGPIDSGTADPLFNQYPYPVDANGVPNPNYPTNCGINMGIARFITSGPGAGQFFQAKGFMNQVTVVDTRDTDPGWTATGNMGTFTNASGKTFGGNQLGWTPKLTSTTASFTDGSGNSYAMTAAQGAVVAANTGGAGGMSAGQPLGTAAAAVTTGTSTTGGLGIAVFDANLKLLIPVFAKSGTYTGVLTISAA
jgi:hypothetical protein